MVCALIVEDDVAFRQELKKTLHENFPSLVVGESAGGEDALQKVKAWRPKLIFTAIKLPGKTGLEITQKIKKVCPQTVIIILTGYDLPEYRHAAKIFGADHFLCKDGSSEEILRLVEAALAHPGDKTVARDS